MTYKTNIINSFSNANTSLLNKVESGRMHQLRNFTKSHVNLSKTSDKKGLYQKKSSDKEFHETFE
jgi:hypothetical protein